MKDKQQRITSFVAGSGITVYETEQYNKNANDWYIVGDSSTSKELMESLIRLHNLQIELK